MTELTIRTFLELQGAIQAAAWALLPRFLEENGIRWAAGLYDTLDEISEGGLLFTGYDGCDPTGIRMPLAYLWDAAFRQAELARRVQEKAAAAAKAATAAQLRQQEKEAAERRQYTRLQEKFG